MDYLKLLGGYTSLPIKLEEIRFLFKENCDLSALNYSLFNMLASYKVFDNYNLLSDIALTPSGIRFNLDKVKKVLLKYYGIVDSKDPIKSLTELEASIKNQETTLPNLSSLMEKDFSKYKLFSYHGFSDKLKKKNKGKRKKFMNLIRKNIKVFIDLLTNEEKYAVVSEDLFDENKLKLYFAYKLMLYARYCEKNNDPTNYQYALSYIARFLEENPSLIASNLTIRFTKRLGKKRAWKEYKIQDLVMFVNPRIPKKAKKEDKLDKYNYSFFECSEENKRELFTQYTRYLTDSNNSEELKSILNRKLALYASLNIIQIKIGVDSFDGYVGLVLDNGKVILDKFYEDRKTGTIATDNALYIVQLADFEKITKMSKTEAIKAINAGEINAVRMLHNKNYEHRVKSYLSRIKPQEN